MSRLEQSWSWDVRLSNVNQELLDPKSTHCVMTSIPNLEPSYGWSIDGASGPPILNFA